MPVRRREPGRIRNYGFSLVELSMVLAIIGLILAGIMTFYANVSTSNQSKDALLEYTVIVAAIHEAYGGTPDYEGIDDATVAALPDFPHKWKSGTQLVAPWNVPLTVLPLTMNGLPNTGLFIVMHNVQPQVCAQIVSKDPGPQAWWTVGGAVPVYGSAQGSAMDPALVQAACGYTSGYGADLALAIN